ncbi:MAG: hypothetical protein ABUS57_20530, partial [Pseudomonadota bacterium]
MAALALAAAGLWGERAPAQTVAPPAVLSFATSGDAGFDAWRADFAARAIMQGRNPDVVRRLLDGLSPDP